HAHARASQPELLRPRYTAHRMNSYVCSTRGVALSFFRAVVIVLLDVVNISQSTVTSRHDPRSLRLLLVVIAGNPGRRYDGNVARDSAALRPGVAPLPREAI